MCSVNRKSVSETRDEFPDFVWRVKGHVEWSFARGSGFWVLCPGLSGEATEADMAEEENRDIGTASVHLVDEEKRFARGLDKYVAECYLKSEEQDDAGLNYHIVSVFGSQSTGKSTLLNRLFGTQFDVMDEEKRQQTTKGIWFSHANYIATADAENNPNGKRENTNNIYVLDVEGVDGRERADDKDFERKSALFALATSEVLIVNIFEHQVGLYQGANMELLKTVMEVNLSLFHEQSQKCLLLFVIRDFTGLTPISNLGQSLEADMNKVWTDLNKPEKCINSKLEDFFDLQFFSIAHKHYQLEQFEYNIKQLGDEFTNDKLFNDNLYHKNIPIDAWALYSENVWDQIENNKDLDLPTQQILVSKFKCNEILDNIYNDLFLNEYSQLKNPLNDPIASCKYFKNLREKCISSYDSQASRYKTAVYTDIRNDLISKIDLKLKSFQSSILSNLSDGLISKLETDFPVLKKSNTKYPFKDLLASVIEKTLQNFKTQSSEYSLVDESKEENNSTYIDNYNNELESLQKKLNDFSTSMKTKESHALISKLTKKFQSKFKDLIVEELSEPSTQSWDNISIKFDDLTAKLLKPYKVNNTFDFNIGLSDVENDKVYLKIQKNFWNKFDSVVHDYINDDSATRILRNIFEDSFKFDSNGLPLIWKTFNQLDSQFNNSREKALDLLPVLCTIKKSDGTDIKKPTFSIQGDDDDIASESDSTDSDDEESDTVNPSKNSRFATLLNTKQQNKVKLRFKKETDAIYLDAKRSMIANKTSIPTFMYVLLILLGWNEFMAVLRNPILFVLAIIVITGLYFAYNMQMLGPMLTVANAMLVQTKTVVKEKLRDVLLDEQDKVKIVTPPISSHPSTEKKVVAEEVYELQDL